MAATPAMTNHLFIFAIFCLLLIFLTSAIELRAAAHRASHRLPRTERAKPFGPFFAWFRSQNAQELLAALPPAAHILRTQGQPPSLLERRPKTS
jgi:hypothetical protein